jgi:serine protease Do
MKLKRIRLLPWAGVLIIGVAVGMVLTSNLGLTPKGVAGKKADPIVLGSQSAPSQELLNAQNTSKAFTVISKEMLPTVVSVATSKIIKRSQQEDDFFNNPFFRDFFGRNNAPRQPQNQKMEGLGSGVIVSKDGYILTNNHVVEQADDIKVTLYDHRQFEAKLVGKDPLTEVAVIKIDAKDLPVARLGNSDELEIGEWVLAFGNPLGLNSTVTAGIVSAKSRGDLQIIQDKDQEKSSGSYAIENFIQTDAAINPGNSGGPLVNLKGQVIGINTAIATGTGYYAGYGFAIPVNLAGKIMNDLINKGYVTRAWLGIGMKPVDENIAERYNLERPRGILVEQVMDDSPAQKAGIKVLDVILKVDGKEVDQSNQVQNYIILKNPGDVVTLSVLRDGKTIAIPVKLGQRDTGKTGEKGEAEEEGEVKLGLTVQNITDAVRQQFDIDRGQEGVVVTDLDANGAAADARLRPGDVLVKIEDKPVKTVADYKKIIRSFPKGKVVIFTLLRGNDTIHAFVKLPK